MGPFGENMSCLILSEEPTDPVGGIVTFPGGRGGGVAGDRALNYGGGPQALEVGPQNY